MSEEYGPSWVRLNLMIHKITGEYHVVGGDRVSSIGGQPSIGLTLLGQHSQPSGPPDEANAASSSDEEVFNPNRIYVGDRMI